MKEYNAAYYQKHKVTLRHQSKRNKLQRLYGITLEEYSTLLEEQDGVCALCSKPPKVRALSVDHCHKTGVNRGLLCTTCNTSLGKFEDSVEILQRAINYLQKYEV